jgi:hypothetical protein
MSGAICHGIFLLEALVFVAEGLAEFLPISSADHLIVASEPPDSPDLSVRRYLLPKAPARRA